MSGCAAILATYSASSSTAFMPFIFGRFGFVFASMLLGSYLALCGYLQQKMLSVAVRYPQVQTMPELAEVVVGRVGYNAYQFLQIANQQLFLPCAMLFVIKALKQIVIPPSSDGYVWPDRAPGAMGCNVTWIFIVFAFALVGTNLQRRFGHAAGLCKLTCVANVVQVALIVARVYLNPQDPSRKLSPADAWPDLALNDTPGTRAYWADIFTAFSSFGYCYVPCFIATEAMQELESKTSVHSALWWSTLYMFVLYTIVGALPVIAWGWDREYEVLSELKGDIFGKTANFMLLLASAMDFLITGISLNQRFQESIDPNFNPQDWSAKACAKWFLYALPSFTITFLMLCFVPNLNSLVGLMTAFVVPFSQLLGPATLTLVAARKGMLGSRLRLHDWIAVLMGCGVGTTMLVLGGASTINSIFFSGPLIKGDFFCKAVAG